MSMQKVANGLSNVFFFCAFAKKISNDFQKFRNNLGIIFKIICGSLTCFSIFSYNIWVVSLYYKILTRYFFKILENKTPYLKKNTKLCFYLCACDQILKSFIYIYKKIKIIFLLTQYFFKILEKNSLFKKNTKLCFYLCAYGQILKSFMYIYKKIKIIFLSYFEKYKN